MTPLARLLGRRRAALAFALAAAVGAVVAYFSGSNVSAAVLSPVYEIEAESQGHRASLANLKIGQPGALEAPTPVDVNGDLLPDLLVAVNLVDVSGAVKNPPTPGAVLAPNIEITRDPAAVTLAKPSPPVRIEVKLTVKDENNLKEDQVLRFGYDTGQNGSRPPECPTKSCPPVPAYGSIPQHFKAIVRGVDTFFNPLQAEVATNGYHGPLDVLGAVGNARGITNTNGIHLHNLTSKLGEVVFPDDDVAGALRFGYRPFPGQVRLVYANGKQFDDTGTVTDENAPGHHLLYDHATREEVDLHTDVALFAKRAKAVDRSSFAARVDRMPRRVRLDFDTGNLAGDFSYRARADGRLPDVHVSTATEKLEWQENGKDKALVPVGAPLFAEVDLEALPPKMSGRWSFPEDGPVAASFEGTPGAGDVPGLGIGALEAAVRNFYNDEREPALPALATPVVPEFQQFLAFESASGGKFGTQTRLRGRVERISEVKFVETLAGAASDPAVPGCAGTTGGFCASLKAGDGELPFLAHFSSDKRSEDDGVRIDGRAVVSPLPDRLEASLASAGSDEAAEPLTLRYASSKSVDVDSRFEVREKGRGDSCGEDGTVCGDLKVRHIPAEITARVASITDPGSDEDDAADDKTEARVEVDAVPRVGGAHPDLFGDVTLGQEDDTPTDFSDDIPLVAHVELLGFPERVRVRMNEGADQTVERVAFHACDFDFAAAPPGCKDAQGEIGALRFGIRNFLTRPAEIDPPSPTTPAYAVLAQATGTADPDVVLFEASGGLEKIKEAQYVNKGGIFGVRARAGDGKDDFSAHVELNDIDFSDDPADSGRIDLEGDATVSPLPGMLNVCFRQAHRQLVALDETFTDLCEAADPFGDGALTRTPMSIAYHADSDPPGAPFTLPTVSGKVHLNQKGNPASALDDEHIRGEVSVTNLPRQLSAHIQTPEKSEEGVMRAAFEAPTDDPAKQVDIAFDAALTTSDLVCKDPRVLLPGQEVPASAPGVLPAGQKALCAKGVLDNLPTWARWSYDPTSRKDNLRVRTKGDAKMNLTGIEVSSVASSLVPNGTGTADDEVKGEILVAAGDVVGLPKGIIGTLDLPGTVEIKADPVTSPLDRVDATVRNFVVPDPMPPDTPPARPITSVESGAAVDPKQTFVVYQRGELFKAIAHIGDLVGAGYATAKDAAGTPLDTKVITADFGVNQTIRAYADLDDGKQQIIADVLLDDVPAGLSVCFRGAKEATNVGKVPVATSFCDLEAPTHDDKGAFQFRARPAPQSATEELDVLAFFRQAKDGGTNVLSARADVYNVPNVVQGTFGNGTVEASGLESDGTTADGIDRIAFDLANADIQDHGYSAGAPWAFPRHSRLVPFGAAPTKQFVRVLADDAEFHVQGRIGELEATGLAGSDLKKLFFSDKVACGAPPTNPNDYPFYPPAAGLGAKYTCVRAEFEEVGSGPDPLSLSAVLDKGGKHIELSDAGLDNVPGFIQLNLAEVDQKLNADGSFRPLCGRASAAGQPAGCLPPLVRFDSPGNAKLFGVFQIGTPRDLTELGKVGPRGDFPNLGESPDPATPWGDSWGDGIRGKIGVFSTPGGDPRPAVRAALRLAVPASLTVDQVRSWSVDKKVDNDNFFDAKDIRFHYVVRNVAADGTTSVAGSLGELAALIQSFPSGEQILVTDDDNDRRGIPIPGEVGFDFYSRNDSGKGKGLVQIDGRTSVPLSLKARIFAGPSGGGVGLLSARVLDAPAPAAGDSDPNHPGWRVRAEMVGKPQEANPAPATVGDKVKEIAICLLWCVKTVVNVEYVDVKFDFKPGGAAAARLVKAVVDTKEDTKGGVQLQAFDNVEGTGAPSSNVSASAFTFLNPFGLFIHAGIPIIGGFDFAFLSSILAGADIGDIPPGGGVKDFALRYNLFNMRADAQGPGNSALALLPINYFLHGEAWVWFVQLLGVHANPGPLAPIDFYNCGFPPVKINPLPNTLVLPSGSSSPITTDVVAWPLGTPPITYTGVLGGAATILANTILAEFFCLLDTDIDLISGDRPADPLKLKAETATHPVPFGTSSSGAPAPPTPAPVDLTLTSGVKPMCGEHTFEDITLTGATIQVATTAGPDCPNDPQALGRLALRATGNITLNSGGRIEGGAGSKNLTVTGRGVTVKTGAVIQGAPVAGPNAEPGLLVTGVGQQRIVTPDRTIPASPGFVNVEKGGRVVAAAGSTNPLVVTATNVTLAAGDATAAPGRVIGAVGKVVLTASDTLTVSGQVLADEVIGGTTGGTTATAIAGAGHGGAGGAGSYGTPGTDYANTSFDTDPADGFAVREAGSVGGGTAAGRGGGTLILTGDVVRVNGTVRARGGAGASFPADATKCSRADDPATTEVNEARANTGTPGTGGGSGGVIVLNATKLDTRDGSVSVRGGRGGDGTAGAGGGGGGGVVKLLAPLRFGPDPSVTGGGKGTSHCTADFNPATPQPGGDGDIPVRETPFSRALSFEDVWKRGTGLSVPYNGSAPDGTSATVFVCGLHRPADQDFPAPSGQSALDPCGNAAELGSTGLSNPSLVSNPASVSVGSALADAADNGYWGVFTVLGYGSFSCPFCMEPLPPKVDMVFAIDNNKPTVAVATPGAATQTGITLDIQAADPATGSEAVSGIKEIICSNDGTRFERCQSGKQGWTLPAGDGPKTVTVRATDVAGNTADEATVDVVLDARSPSSTAQIVVPGGVQVLQNGWYSASPHFRIENFNDDFLGIFGSGPALNRYEFWFDEGEPRTCNDPCTITSGLPGPGRHQLRFRAVDLAGNKQAVQELAVKIDGENPLAALSSVPEAPNGANGWFRGRPWVALSGIDRPVGGAGFEAGPGETQIGGLFYRLDGGAPQPFTGAIQLAARSTPHEVCFRSIDQAGRADLGSFGAEPSIPEYRAAGRCRVYLVDDAAPTVALERRRSGVAAAPNGDNGWYIGTRPTVAAVPDDAGGSGFHASPPFPDTLCAPIPKVDDPRPSGVCLSVNGRPFSRYTGEVTIPEGEHEVLAFAVDVSGQRSRTVTVDVDVDLSPPVSAARVIPPDPARRPWWRNVPTVVLRATDGERNAGLSGIVYSIDNGAFKTYEGPFTLPEGGTRTVTYYAVDRSGQQETANPAATDPKPEPRKLTVPTDLAPPRVRATSPQAGLSTVSPVPVVWSPLLGPVKLRWTVADNLRPWPTVETEKIPVELNATIVIHNAAGQVVRRLNHGDPMTLKFTVNTGVPPVEQTTLWHGEDESLLGLVPAGVYYYRVVVVDAAGNTAHSGESSPLQVKLGL